MSELDWQERWREGRIGFHQQRYTQALVQYADELWGTGGLGRVLVPLCGKTLDMVYLRERADEVVGVEYVRQAVEEFFDERGLEPVIDAGPPLRYRAGGYTLYVADFFDVTRADVGEIDAVFDRASLVALPPDVRPRYADHLRTLLPSGARMLLVTFDYHQSRMNGPPFSVPPEEVDELFADGFALEQRGRRDVLDDNFRQRGLDAMHETVFFATRQ